MQPQSEYPLNEWFVGNQKLRDTETWLLVEALDAAHSSNGDAIRLEETWEDWFNHRSEPVPDLVKCVALYGYSRLLVQGWKEFPVEVPADQAGAWREWGLGASLFEFREQRQAGVAGGFLELAARDPDLTRSTLGKQLQNKLAELTSLLERPIEEYTPQYTEAALTARFKAEGFDEDEVRERVETEVSEEDAMYEPSQLGRPFTLYEQLMCFSYALQKLRMFCLTEEDKELGLPNKPLYEALMKIDLNQLLAQLNKVEPKLKAILRHLAKLRYFHLDIDSAPEGFWWRHWKAEIDKQHQDRQARGGHKSQSNDGKSDRSQQPRPNGTTLKP